MRNWLKNCGPSILALVVFFGVTVIAGMFIVKYTDPPAPKNENGNRVSVTIPVTDSRGFGPRTIHPCPTEDSDNCYRLFGGRDGKGMSFVVIDGQTYYLAG